MDPQRKRWSLFNNSVFKILTTFCLVCFCWIFFRAESVSQALNYIVNICDLSILDIPYNSGLKLNLPLISLLFIVEWIQKEKQHGLQLASNMPVSLRWIIYTIVCILILLMGNFNKTEFIYFAF